MGGEAEEGEKQKKELTCTSPKNKNGKSPPGSSTIKKRADFAVKHFVDFNMMCTDVYGVDAVGGCCGCGPDGIKGLFRHYKLLSRQELPT